MLTLTRTYATFSPSRVYLISLKSFALVFAAGSVSEVGDGFALGNT